MGWLGKGQLLELGYGGCMAQLEESLAVGVIGEDVLTVDASEHDVVDA